MSKLAEQLRAIRVINNWDLLTKFGGINDVAIEYSAPASGRAGWCDVSETTVWSPRSNPKLTDQARINRSRSPHKSFIGKRKESLPKALAWARATFGDEYVPSPHGGYIGKHVLAKAKAAVKEAANVTT